MRHIFVILLLALVPVLASAQTGRSFVSAEAYVGLARVVHVGKIIEIKRIEYKNPLTNKDNLGEPCRLVFEVGETSFCLNVCGEMWVQKMHFGIICEVCPIDSEKFPTSAKRKI